MVSNEWMVVAGFLVVATLIVIIVHFCDDPSVR